MIHSECFSLGVILSTKILTNDKMSCMNTNLLLQSLLQNHGNVSEIVQKHYCRNH